MRIQLSVLLFCTAALGVAAQGDFLAIAKPGVAPADIVGRYGGALRSHVQPRLFVFKPGAGVSLETLRRDRRFTAVTIDRLLEPCALPNDPLVPQQWHLTQISAPRAWDYATGGGGPIVAVVDAGCETTHPDLAANMVPGYNTISGLAETAGGAVNDIGTTGHGTRCMSIAVAKGNNGVGISGVGWNLRGMPIRATNNSNGTALISELLEGVTWAVNNGARVVSVSYSGVADPTIEATGAWARTQGALLVWAAGNDNADLFNFDHKNVTIVGGTDQQDAKISLSNYGRAVDCYAPATQVYTARKGGLYGNMPAGTSAAAPQVAAVLALIMEREPSLTANAVERRMLLRCRDLGVAGEDATWGWGRLNAGTGVGWPSRTYDVQFLPLPNGFLFATGLNIDDHGRVIAIGSDQQDNALSFRSAIAYVDNAVSATRSLGYSNIQGSPNALFFPVVMNNNGQVGVTLDRPDYYNVLGTGVEPVVNYGMPTTETAVQWNFISGTFLNFGSSGSGYVFRISGINQNGTVVGQRNYGVNPGNFQMLQHGFTAPTWTAVPNPVGPWFAEFTDINDLGESTGFQCFTNPGYYNVLSDAQPFVFTPPNTYTSLSNSMGVVSRARVIGNDGKVYGEAGSTRHISNLRPVVWDIRTGGDPSPLRGPDGVEIGQGRAVTAVNDLGEILGRDYNVSPPADYIFDGVTAGRVRDMLSVPLPPGFGDLRVGQGINNRGEMAASVLNFSTNSYVPVKLMPNDGRFVGIGFGDQGANPVYIGSIPPALNVTFTDANGVALIGTTVNVAYNSATGQLPLVVPNQVGNSFRMYVRANRNLIPGYEGTLFLPRLIPPMDQPPAPRDIAYLPPGGEPGPTGQPSIQLFAGDVDGSNEIDAADIDLVIAAFGSVNGDPGWDPDPDCDGSGEIDAADIDLVIANFGLTGDPEP